MLSTVIRNEQTNRKNMFNAGFADRQSFDTYLTNRFVRLTPTGKYFDLTKEGECFLNERVIKNLITESNLYAGDEDSALTAFKKKKTGLVDVEGIKYQPDREKLFRLGDSEYLNLYKPPNLDRQQATAIQRTLFNDYISLLANIEEERLFLLQWLSHIAHNPEKRTQVGVLLYGKSHGVGKGTFQELMSGLVGHPNTFKPADSASFITGRFKAELKTKRLLILDELYHNGFKVSNAAKPLVTEPTIALEGKGDNQVMSQAWFEIVASSNSIQPLWLEKHDRRWFCLRVEKPNPNSKADPLNIQFDNTVRSFRLWLEDEPDQAIAVIRSLLDEINLDDFKPWITGALVTKDQQELVHTSVSTKQVEFEKDWKHYLSTMGKHELIIKYDEWFETYSPESVHTPSTKKSYLEHVGCTSFGVAKQIQGERSRSFMITPLGFEVGITKHSTGSKISAITSDYAATIIDEGGIFDVER
jgi:hypothetical protein